jgi:hypothetical protein
MPLPHRHTCLVVLDNVSNSSPEALLGVVGLPPEPAGDPARKKDRAAVASGFWHQLLLDELQPDWLLMHFLHKPVHDLGLVTVVLAKAHGAWLVMSNQHELTR